MTAFTRGQLNPGRNGIEGTPRRSQTWALDGLGNWDTVTTTPQGGPPAPQARTHNRQNQIEDLGGASLGYDRSGNTVVGEPGKAYAYDAWNRLVRVTASGLTVTYTFDALGRRVKQTKSGGADAGTREFSYSDGWQILEERDGLGVVVAQNVWSPVYVDALVLRDQGGQRLYVQQDANFNVTAITDAAGTVLERYVYDPYGAVTVLNADWQTPPSLSTWVYLHQGGRYDGETGLYDFRNRYYEPKLGRWLNLDPIDFAGGSNLYAYEDNGPASATDPWGLDPMMPSRATFLRGVGPPTDWNYSMMRAPSPAYSGPSVGAMPDPRTLPRDVQWINEATTPYERERRLAIAEAMRAGDPFWWASLSFMFRTPDSPGHAFIAALPGHPGILPGSMAVGRGPVPAAAAGRGGRGGAPPTGITSRTPLPVVDQPRIGATAPGGKGVTGKWVWCFPPGTLVLMADGTTRPIEQIQPGDQILADDPEDSDTPSAKPVVAVLQNYTYNMVHLSFDANGDGKSDGVLEATREHPIWTKNRGWQDAARIESGDVLQDHEGKAIRVLSTWVEKTDMDTFNLSVAELHTFFVVVNGTTILVHNTDPWDIMYSHPLPPERLERFIHGPWAGRTIEEAIIEARRLGRLPDGLVIEAQEVILPNRDRRLIAVNNRTLFVAQLANLRNVTTIDNGGETYHKLQRNFRESGLGVPLERPC